jgi:starvation-inducible DNA-binding protein
LRPTGPSAAAQRIYARIAHENDRERIRQTAETIFEVVALLAERVRKLGGTTIRSIGDVSRRQTIPDDDDDFVAPQEMVRRLLGDNRHIAAQRRAAIAVCHEHGDGPTSNISQDLLDQTERRVWFLFAILQQD